jgi:hypothetical protein
MPFLTEFLFGENYAERRVGTAHRKQAEMWHGLVGNAHPTVVDCPGVDQKYGNVRTMTAGIIILRDE